MLVAKDFREKARNALQGKWAVAVGTGFVAGLAVAYTALENYYCGATGMFILSSKPVLNLIFGSMSREMLLLILTIIIIFAYVVAPLVSFLQLAFRGVISVGYAEFNLNLVDGNDTDFIDLFSGFSKFWRAFAMQFLRRLFIALWSLLFVIPGIIAALRYAMAPYLLAEDPLMGPYEALQESSKLMEGNKWRLFCLGFSFIGWNYLCLLTLGIGDLWLRPYKEASYAAFYREIKDRKYSDPYRAQEEKEIFPSYLDGSNERIFAD